MGREIRIACVGEWHVHGKDFSYKLEDYPGCRAAAVCSDNPETGRAWARELGCIYEADYELLIKNPGIDAVMITSATSDHARQIIMAANAGKHIFVEKALAVTNQEAYEIKSAVEKNRIHFTMSDPVMKAPQMFAKKIVEEGKLGRITNARIRVVHPLGITGCHKPQFYNRSESGGGAMIDMGCKAVHTLYQLFGKAVRVCACFQSYTDMARENGVEENAVAVYEFPNGVIGIAETGWASPKYQYALDIYGTDGCIAVSDHEIKYRLNSGDWKLVPETSLPDPMIYPLTDWIDSIQNGRPSRNYGIEEAVHITEMITAAYRSEGMGITV